MTTALQSGNYPTLTAWLAHQLDPRCYPDPLSSTMTVPSILPDETPTDYIQCLSTLGLNANPTETLGDSQVDWGTPASDVVNVQPAPGVAVNPGSDVTIDANPDTMPTPTQREADLATVLLAKNPGITDENKLDIARSCLDLEDAATGNTDTTGDPGDASFANCSTMPIFITGNDAQSAGQHDLIALGVPGVATDPTLTFSDAYGGVKPAWAQLSRDVSGKDGTWKNTLQPCNSDTPPEAQCDEYPFLSSQQRRRERDPTAQPPVHPRNPERTARNAAEPVLQRSDADEPRHERLQHHLRDVFPRDPSANLRNAQHDLGVQRAQRFMTTRNWSTRARG